MIGVIWNEGGLDLARDENGWLALDEGFDTPVLVSLHVDRRAPAGSGKVGEAARGYWADAFEERPWGSLLWLLLYEPLVEAEVGPRLRAYVEQSLSWMTSSAAAVSIEIRTSVRSRDTVQVRIEIEAAEGGVWAVEWRWTRDRGLGS